MGQGLGGAGFLLSESHQVLGLLSTVSVPSSAWTGGSHSLATASGFFPVWVLGLPFMEEATFLKLWELRGAARL
jgi:hypothetical protein